MCSAMIGFFTGYSQVVPTTFSQIRMKIGPYLTFSKPVSIPSTMELLGRLSAAHRELEQSLIMDYGDMQGLLFDKPGVIDRLFMANPISKERLYRRMMIKVLSAQIEIAKNNGGDDGKQKKKKRKKKRTKHTASTFTWATGGDSAAAGHGNLFSQSYTKVMEDSVKDAFAAVGVDFIARNYAMAGYTSAPELSMCMESVYGTDVDILAWDFGLQEQGVGVEQLSLWASRAGVHPTHPILMLIDTPTPKYVTTNNNNNNNNNNNDRWSQLLRFEEAGMGTILMDQSKNHLYVDRIPESMVVGSDGGGSDGQQHVPTLLRNFKCYGNLEGAKECDDPMRHYICEEHQNDANHDNMEKNVCIQQKFKTELMCNNGFAKWYQTSWHPGWKAHYIKGKLLALYLLEALKQAILEIDQRTTAQLQQDGTTQPPPPTTDQLSNLELLLQRLQLEDDNDMLVFQNSPVLFDTWETNRDTLYNINPSVLFRSRHVICHTALLPSRIRYDGILTETTGVIGGDSNNYDRGMNKYFENKYESISLDGKLPLVYDPNDRQRCQALEIDHKDFFYVREGDDFLAVTVPNDSELEAYDHNPTKQRIQTITNTGVNIEKRMGLIMVCLKICPLKRCPDNSIGFGSIKRNSRKLVIRVDGKLVTGVQKLGGCHFLEGEENGLLWGPGKDDKGRYRISFKINEVEKWMKISSIIVL